MKIHLALGIASVMMVTAAANAEDYSADRLKLAELNFTCEFKEGHNPFPHIPVPGRNEFKAFAKVLAFVGDDGHISAAPQVERDLTNKLAVLKDSELIYANGAILKVNKKFLDIEGINGPSVIIERRENERSMDHNEYRSWLKLKGERIRGECRVRVEPVRPALD